ncbi:ergothioneine biosynthesis protein EgtB [Rubrobacter tropicus]|uniref:Hercynine oxygenase n=1 Tax=Rubrobacter tropicus TaxID=2653851 RepID=A0A6G8QBL4_9ACTN|nr:ergothioneine biosynthesis protein EgtB [Rubrobacter tropicus]QIN83822.1 ergothioneine biosynthesis protein EgtB [Rubrobacter tropicus]
MDTKRAVQKEMLARRLEEARGRTRFLLGTVSDEDLAVQHDPIMSPLIWDYGHIGNYEELWLLEKAFGRGLSDRDLYDMYDASLHPREERPSLNLLDRADAGLYLDAVRGAALDALEEADLEGEDPLLRDGFVYNMILQHEYQHNETMLQTLQLSGSRYRPDEPAKLPAGDPAAEGEMVRVPGGPFVMGTDDRALALDNERGAHEVDVPGFHLDKTPVTNRAYLEFVEDGGYENENLWDPKGWAWVQSEGITAPKHWYQPDPHSWWTVCFGFDEPLRMDAPVVHVSWFEADAYARWAGKRLPTEAEWEKAASWDPETGTGRPFPWGHEPWSPNKANLDQLALRPAPVGSHPAGASPCGALGMIGDVWEWTASEFSPYPNFQSFPYKEYSEIFFDDGYKILRGGSWATRPGAVRNTFRNWDFPIRRQLFVGFRCAKS